LSARKIRGGGGAVVIFQWDLVASSVDNFEMQNYLELLYNVEKVYRLLRARDSIV
jgi:hypothetical protein